MARTTFQAACTRFFGIVRPAAEILDPAGARRRHPLEEEFRSVMIRFATGCAWSELDGLSPVPGSVAAARHRNWSAAGMYDALFFLVANLYRGSVELEFERRPRGPAGCRFAAEVENAIPEGPGRLTSLKGPSGTRLSPYVRGLASPLRLTLSGAHASEGGLLETALGDSYGKLRSSVDGGSFRVTVVLDRGYHGYPSELAAFVRWFSAHALPLGEIPAP